jgi:hypothetical protein
MPPGPRALASVIIPVFNLRAFLAEAIDSVLAQTLSRDEVEIVVVDDGSTDGSDEVARRFLPRIHYVAQANRGLSAARNAGIRASRAPALAFLDADDRFLPDKLAASLALLAKHPEVGIAYSRVRYIDAAGNPLPGRGSITRDGDLLPDLLLGNLIHPNAAVVRRELVEAAGGFDETLTSLEDWDLWLRLSLRGAQWACVPRPLAEYRIRADAMHQNHARMADNALRVLDKFFADPTLPAEVAARRALAYQHAHLIAAADEYRVGDRTAGAARFRRAAETRPEFLGEPRALRRFCRLLLPPEAQGAEAEAAEALRLGRTLRVALHDLFTASDLPAPVARQRRRARVAYGLTLLHLVRRRFTRGGAAR